MSYLKAKDTISGQEGTAFAQIADASGNKSNEEMFYVKKLEAKAEKDKVEVRTLGKRGTQHKAKGWKGTGTMTIYYVTTKFRRMMYDYMSSGKDTYFDILVTNNDPSSDVGTQKITLKNVNLDSVIMALLDTESDTLEEEIAFTFDGVEMGGDFTAPTLSQ